MKKIKEYLDNELFSEESLTYKIIGKKNNKKIKKIIKKQLDILDNNNILPEIKQDTTNKINDPLLKYGGYGILVIAVIIFVYIKTLKYNNA